MFKSYNKVVQFSLFFPWKTFGDREELNHFRPVSLPTKRIENLRYKRET